MSMDTPIPEDRFGVFSALLIHHVSGGDDTALDLSIFPSLVLRVYRKSKAVLKEVFDDDKDTFLTLIMTRVFLAKVEEDFEMLAIEHWLDVELKEAGIHPREYT